MSDLVAEFKAFDENNPHVYRLFVRFAKEAIARGRRNLSVALIVERIRWETMVTTQAPDGFKINNNFRAAYARKFEQDHPEFKGFFRTRHSQFDWGLS